MNRAEHFPWRDRFKGKHKYFCPPPPTRATRVGGSPGSGVSPGESIDKVRSALALEYVKNLHYTIAHLRRADGGLRPKTADAPTCSMDLFAEKRYGLTVDWVMLLESDLIRVARFWCCR